MDSSRSTTSKFGHLTPESDAVSEIETPGWDRRPRFWQRDVKPSEIAAAIVIVSAIASVMSFRDLPRRVASLEIRADSTERKQALSLFIQCVQIRLNNPELAPSGCEPIIRKGAP